MATATVGTVERRRFSAEDYHRMSEQGILHPDERTELLDGVIYTMCAIGSGHIRCVNRVNRWAVVGVGDRGLVSIQNSLRLNDFSEPEPDIVILRPSPDDYGSAVPTAEAVLLLIEVADTSLGWDRDIKLPRYAESGIREVWIADVTTSRINVYRDPSGSAYRHHSQHAGDDGVTPLAFPDLSLRCSDLFA